MVTLMRRFGFRPLQQYDRASRAARIVTRSILLGKHVFAF
jgi:hypothetical protein